MKPVLGLPGRNPETGPWMSDLLSALGADEVEVARYSHWQSGGEPDLARELAENPVAGRALVVAKSMGTMVLLAAAEHGTPNRAVLIGTPVQAYTGTQIEALRALAEQFPCLFIQQTDDFTGSAASLRAVLGEKTSLCEVPGSDHVYADVEELAALIANWQASLDG